jgi:HEAT repeat protein
VHSWRLHYCKATLSGTYVDEVAAKVKKLGHEKAAVSALLELLTKKSNSKEKRDHLVCARAIRAVGMFGPHAEEAIPLLQELKKHNAAIVGSAADVLLKRINEKQQTDNPQKQKKLKSPKLFIKRSWRKK